MLPGQAAAIALDRPDIQRLSLICAALDHPQRRQIGQTLGGFCIRLTEQAQPTLQGILQQPLGHHRITVAQNSTQVAQAAREEGMIRLEQSLAQFQCPTGNRLGLGVADRMQAQGQPGQHLGHHLLLSGQVLPTAQRQSKHLHRRRMVTAVVQQQGQIGLSLHGLRVILTEQPPAFFQRASIERIGGLVLTGLVQHQRQTVQTDRHLRSLVPEQFAMQVERLSEQTLGGRVVTAASRRTAEPMQRFGHCRMTIATQFTLTVKRLLEHRSGIVEQAQAFVQTPQCFQQFGLGFRLPIERTEFGPTAIEQFAGSECTAALGGRPGHLEHPDQHRRNLLGPITLACRARLLHEQRHPKCQ